MRASSPIWASEASHARTRERGAKERRLTSLAQIGELARRLGFDRSFINKITAVISSVLSAKLDTKSQFPNWHNCGLKHLCKAWSIKHNPPKLPSFYNVCAKFYLNSLKNSRDINVLKDVGQAKLCLMKLFIDRCPLRLTATSLFVPFC